MAEQIITISNSVEAETVQQMYYALRAVAEKEKREWPNDPTLEAYWDERLGIARQMVRNTTQWMVDQARQTEEAIAND